MTKALLSTFSNENLLAQYRECKTLSALAEKLGVGLETLRKYFLANQIPYQKQIKHACDDFFFSRDNEESFYWAGFLAADGSVESEKPRICLNLATKDVDHLHKFKQALCSESPVKSFIRQESRPEFLYKEYYSSSIKIRSLQLVDDLKRFNILPSKSKTYQFPMHLADNPNIRHFIRGIIDGDGHLAENHSQGGQHSSIWICGTRNCMESIQLIMKSVVPFPDKLSVYGREDGLWIFRSGKLQNNQAIIHYLYDQSKIWLDRKQLLAQEILKCLPRKITLSKEALLKSFTEHQNATKVAAELNVSPATLHRRVDELGITAEVNACYLNPNNKKWEVLSGTQLQEEYHSLGSINKVAKKYDVSNACIERALLRHDPSFTQREKDKKDRLSQMILETYAKNGTVRGTARILKLPRDRVKYFLDKRNK